MEIDALELALGHRFRDANLLRLALTHPSVAYEQGRPLQHNQRLEFLGDAVLQLILTRALFERFPDFGEGSLTKARSRLVNRRFLAEQARHLDLGRHLLMSRGEETHGGRGRPSALADAFEAVLGALYLDGGFETAATFVLRQLASEFEALHSLSSLDNPKGELQERLQVSAAEPPQYQLERARGPDHDREFECAVYHQGNELGRGWGKSKKEAESRAAQAALERLRATAANPG